jgi:DNA-binding NarL/FixJ family response regulator
LRFPHRKRELLAVSPDMVSRDDQESEPPMLTPREREVLELMAQGYESIQIAAHMGISQHAVEDHRHRMYAKVGQHNAIMVLREFFNFVPKENLKQSEVHHGKAEERTQTETRPEAQTTAAGRRISKLSFASPNPQRESP